MKENAVWFGRNYAAFFIDRKGISRLQEEIKVIFLVNAAVLLEFRGTKLLIDGIYDEKGHCFSNLSPEQWDKMKKGQEMFSDIDYLLFTHEHGDHFSPRRVIEYLDHQQPKAIFMPMEGSAALDALRKKAEEKKIPCALLNSELCRTTVFRPEKDIRIKAFPTRHLDKIYWDVQHFCYLVECGEKKMLFTSDVDFTQESFTELEHVPLDGIFVNPLMSHSKEGRRLLSEGVLQAKTKFVYHIPFAGDDKMGVRKIAEQELRAEREKNGNSVFFLEEGQTCTL